MSKTSFIKEGPDERGRIYIIEGEKQPNSIFSVKRFVCEVQQQQNETETQKVADLLVKQLNRKS